MEIKRKHTGKIETISFDKWERVIVAKNLQDQYEILELGRIANIYQIADDGQRSFYRKLDFDHAARMVSKYPTKYAIEEIENPAMLPNSEDEIKVFVSFSTKQENLARDFCDTILDNGLGLKPSEIYCTAIEGKIKNGEDFKQSISSALKKSKFAIQIISEDYKASEVCLNEMGAIWVLCDHVLLFVVEDRQYDVGFINGSKQQHWIFDESGIFNACNQIADSIGLPINIVALHSAAKKFIATASRLITEQVPEKAENFLEEIQNSECIENSLWKINNRAGIHVYQNGKFRMIPESSLLRYIMGFDIQVAREATLKFIQTNGEIGVPILPFTEFKYYREEGHPRIWAIAEGQRHFIPPPTWLIVSRSAKIPLSNIPVDELFKIEEGNQWQDTKGRFH